MTNSKDPSEYIESGYAKFKAEDYLGTIDDFSKAIDFDSKDANTCYNRDVAMNKNPWHENHKPI